VRVWSAGPEVPTDRRQCTGESCAAARNRFNQCLPMPPLPLIVMGDERAARHEARRPVSLLRWCNQSPLSPVIDRARLSVALAVQLFAVGCH
jgi:hypothetical protein